jgi:hypothetical protein
MFNKIRGLIAVLAVLVASQARASRIDDWRPVGDANWSVADGEFRANSGNGFLVTKKSYRDFDLSLEFQPGENTNSGVFFRCASLESLTDSTCYEANIFDRRPDPSGRTGSIVDVAPPTLSINTEGRWNRYEISARGNRLVIWLNGVKTVDVRDNRLGEGPIALQFAAGDIRFRDIAIQAEPNIARDIVGVWTLTKFELDDGQGTIRPWCEGAFGSIAYFNGHMSVAINCTSEPTKTLFYSGPYALEGSTVIHKVRNYSDPSLNKHLRRTVEMSDSDSLVLKGPLGESGTVSVVFARDSIQQIKRK